MTGSTARLARTLALAAVILAGSALGGPGGPAPTHSAVAAPAAHLVALRSAASAAAPCPPAGTSVKPPTTFQHVIWILEENQSASGVIGSPQAPYFTGISSKCGLASNWHNVSHSSLTNYVGALSGQLSGTALKHGKDCGPKLCPQPQASLLGQVQATGHTWKMYSESMPSTCSRVLTSLYVPKHAPAPYFSDVAGSCAGNDVPLSNSPGGGPTVAAGSLLTDITYNSLPTFAFISPNLCDDGHTIGGACHSSNHVAAMDVWLAAWLPALLNSPAYAAGSTAIFITWDEGNGRDTRPSETCWDAAHANATAYPSCSVAMLVISPYTPPTVSTTWFNHYNLLQATEAMLGLPALPTSKASGGVPTPNDARVAFNL